MEVHIMTQSTNIQVEVSSGSSCNDKILTFKWKLVMEVHVMIKSTNLQVEVSIGSACNDKIH
jgi:hypothetical protein